MKYNVANSLLAGHGFWGNLELMTHEQRKWVGEQVEISKKLLPYTVDVDPQVLGKVGDSPEIYSVVNKNEAAGQIIVFSEEPFQRKFSTEVKSEKLLAVLNQPFTLENNRLDITFQSSEKESSFFTFVLPNKNSGISMQFSNSAVTELKQQNNQMEYTVSAPGEQVILWNKELGKPVLKNSKIAEIKVSENNDYYRVEVKVKKKNVPVVIQSE